MGDMRAAYVHDELQRLLPLRGREVLVLESLRLFVHNYPSAFPSPQCKDSILFTHVIRNSADNTPPIRTILREDDLAALWGRRIISIDEMERSRELAADFAAVAVRPQRDVAQVRRRSVVQQALHTRDGPWEKVLLRQQRYCLVAQCSPAVHGGEEEREEEGGLHGWK